MKHYLKHLLLCLCLFAGTNVLAYHAEINNIYYNFSGDEATVTYRYSDYRNSSAYSGNIVIPESVTYNGKPYSVTSIGYEAFRYCYGLTSVTIPNSVTSIGNIAFQESGLTSITIPNSVKSIGGYAFRYCSGLTSITIGNSVTSIGDLAFQDCTGLTSITIPESVTSIGDYTFYGCSSLTSVTIPGSVTSIGNSAFYGCSGLTSVTIPGSVTSIGYDAFSGTAWYKNQPDGLVYAGKVAYKYKGTMPSDTRITIEEGTLGIADGAFRVCSGLTSITIPNSVTYIGNSAFSGCYGLTSITIPGSVTSIGIYAFYNCSGLTSITIPNSVTSIGEGVFSNCSGLTDVYCYAENVPTTDSDAFYSSPISSTTLHVPAGSLEAYKTTSPWSKFGTIVAIEEDTKPNIEEIDLGLPSGTLWANMNVGAKCPEGYGDYFAWGETAPKTEYSWSTYKYCHGSYKTLTKYCYESSSAYNSSTDTLAELLPEDDAATANWGQDWQMPSQDQIKELFNSKYTTTTWTTQNGVNGRLVKSKKNGKTLFLPAAGSLYETTPNNVASYGRYWSRSLSTSQSSNADALVFYSDTINWSSYRRDYGRSVRPVRKHSSPNVTDLLLMNYAVYAKPAKVRKGSQTTLTVCMKNAQPITLWQADLILPTGFTLAVDKYDDFMVSISGSRTSTSRHSISTSTLSDGSIRILCSSSSNKTFTGNDGEVATITINIASNVNDGDYILKLSNIKLVETNETKHEVDEVVSVVNVKSYTLGDVNDDGSIDGVDLVGIVNYILERPTPGNIREAADVNLDGTIDGTDYVREANAILGKVVLSARHKARRAETTEADYAVYANDLEVIAGQQATLCLNMKNDQPVTLWQADLVLPEGVSIATDNFDDPMVSITGGRTTEARHGIATNTLPDGSIRILCSSNSNKTFTGNDGEVATITLNIDKDTVSGEYPVMLKNILMVEADETRHGCDYNECTLSITNPTGIYHISTTSEEDGQVYNLSGQQLSKPARGINIVNGKKRIIK